MMHWQIWQISSKQSIAEACQTCWQLGPVGPGHLCRQKFHWTWRALLKDGSNLKSSQQSLFRTSSGCIQPCTSCSWSFLQHEKAAIDTQLRPHHHGGPQSGSASDIDSLSDDANLLIADTSTCSLVGLQGGRKVVALSVRADPVEGEACAGDVKKVASTAECACALEMSSGQCQPT